MKCKICGTRKPRRYCPGVSGDICSVCCGTEREVTVDCPLDCEYLEEARLHERAAPLVPKELPNRDIEVTEEFLQRHERLLLFIGVELVAASLATPGAVDFDVRDALEALIRTHRTLQSGLYYETKPNNLVAAAIQQRIQDAIQKLRADLQEKGGGSIRDAEILGILVFLERLGMHQYNGRPRGRAFIDYLRKGFPQPQEHPLATPSLIQT